MREDDPPECLGWVGFRALVTWGDHDKSLGSASWVGISRCQVVENARKSLSWFSCLFVLIFFFFPFAKYVSRADIGLKRRGTLSWNDRTRGGDGFKQKEGSS